MTPRQRPTFQDEFDDAVTLGNAHLAKKDVPPADHVGPPTHPAENYGDAFTPDEPNPTPPPTPHRRGAPQPHHTPTEATPRP
ncbi:hypothetical protein ACFQLX_03365, partial [Streptomyces polyrhachis]